MVRIPKKKDRLSLLQVFRQIRAFQDLGVTFGVFGESGFEEIRIAAPADMLEPAAKFRDAYIVEMRVVAANPMDTRTLDHLDFLKWRVEQDHFGPRPGQRVIVHTAKDDNDDD